MKVHIVQKGETIWKIAKKYGLNFEELKRLNAHLANPDYIVPGMEIFIPIQKECEPDESPKKWQKPEVMEEWEEQEMPWPQQQEMPWPQQEMPWSQQQEMPWEQQQPMPWPQQEMPWQQQQPMPWPQQQPMPMPMPQQQPMPMPWPTHPQMMPWPMEQMPYMCMPPFHPPMCCPQPMPRRRCQCGETYNESTVLNTQHWRNEQHRAYYNDLRALEMATNCCHRTMQPWQ